MTKKTAVLLVGIALTAGALVTVTSTTASAAANCSAYDQSLGSARTILLQKQNRIAKVAKKLKKAKKANKSHHSTATEKKVKKLRKTKRRVTRQYHAARAAYASASSASVLCHTQSQLPAGASTDPNAPIDPNDPSSPSYASLVYQLTAALSGLGLPADVVGDMVVQILDTLNSAGLPVDQFASVLQGLITQLQAAAGGELPSDPNGLIDLVTDTLKSVVDGVGLGSTPLPAAVDQLNDALKSLLGSLLGGLPVPGL
ncbi:MAG: hypothetical protein QM595_16165 [Nocardioides sp.]